VIGRFPVSQHLWVKPAQRFQCVHELPGDRSRSMAADAGAEAPAIAALPADRPAPLAGPGENRLVVSA
jgi:hypothetical protein